jgi:transcriptional regulator with XRE-family HTH domain
MVLTKLVNTGTLVAMASRELSQLLRDLREGQGTSLRAAAKDLRVDPAYLSRVERGQKAPSKEMLKRAADYYDVPDEALSAAAGQLPPDIVSLLIQRPDLIERLRSEHGSG